MTIRCSDCNKKMEFIRRHCPYCGSRQLNWVFEFFLQTCAVIFIIVLGFAISDSPLFIKIIALFVSIMYVIQIIILVETL